MVLNFGSFLMKQTIGKLDFPRKIKFSSSFPRIQTYPNELVGVAPLKSHKQKEEEEEEKGEYLSCHFGVKCLVHCLAFIPRGSN